VNAPALRIEGERLLPRVSANGLAPSLERKRLQVYATQIAVDAVLLLTCFAGVATLYFGHLPNAAEMLVGNLLLPIFLTIALHNGTYSLTTLTDWKQAAGRMASSLLIAAVLLTFIAYFVKVSDSFSRMVLLGGVTSSLAVLTAIRFLSARWLRALWGPSPMNLLVIDAGGPPIRVPHAYRINADEHGLQPVLDDPHMLDRFARYLRNMDQVVVNCPPEHRAAWAMVLKGSGVHGEVTSGIVREIGALGVVHREDADVSSILVSTGPLGLRDRVAKRLFDIVVSGLALLALSPVLLGAALLIKLEDGGPVFFRQRRLGQGNRFFRIYKLRSMRVEQSDADGNRSASKDDDRITRIGSFLRKTSLDELPQLINVLHGDMSIVGPRPHALGSQAGNKLFWQVDRRYWQRHCLRPGITGLAQIRGFRGATDKESDLTGRLQADLEYLAGWSIWRDIRIIFATAKVVVHDRAF
jgi:polysaccharide biosynthesis protein PslA